MNPFIDIAGAAGAIYRFRLVDDPTLMPSEAGNFMIVRGVGDDRRIVCCGTALSLVGAAPTWEARPMKHASDGLYVRLNVSRSARRAEHDDIVGLCQPELILDELDDARVG